LKAALEKAFPGIEVQLIKGKGGAFEIRSGDTLVFSKKKSGRFPTHDEIIATLRK
jgi:selT/selW/selH-like putative selenoprotein